MVLVTGSCDVNPNEPAVRCTSPSACVSAFLLRLFVGSRFDKEATYSRAQLTNSNVIATFRSLVSQIRTSFPRRRKCVALQAGKCVARRLYNVGLCLSLETGPVSCGCQAGNYVWD